MRFSLVSAALLCLATWMSVVNATHGPVASCCIGWSNTKVPITQIQNYTIQSEGRCLIKAVVLQTTVGKRICSDPDSGWAKKAMRKVDEEKKNKELQEKQQSEEGSTSTITPAVSSTSTNAGPIVTITPAVSSTSTNAGPIVTITPAVSSTSTNAGPIVNITPAASRQSQNIPKKRRSKYARRRHRIKFARKRRGQRKRV